MVKIKVNANKRRQNFGVFLGIEENILGCLQVEKIGIGKEKVVKLEQNIYRSFCKNFGLKLYKCLIFFSNLKLKSFAKFF